MSVRRVLPSQLVTSNAKLSGDVFGLADEEITTEFYQPYGLSSNPQDLGETILIEVNGDPDNFVTLPPSGPRQADERTTVLYYRDTTITLEESRITVEVGGNSLTIEGGRITTDLDIVTSGMIEAASVTAGGVGLGTHVHTGVATGMGLSGTGQG